MHFLETQGPAAMDWVRWESLLVDLGLELSAKLESVQEHVKSNGKGNSVTGVSKYKSIMESIQSMRARVVCSDVAMG